MKSRDEDFQKIQTVSDLKQFVRKQSGISDEAQGQKRFALRVFYVLQYVKSHPEALEEIGASWCNDGFHFVANSTKLGDFLDLKSNSINTNFRDHKFKIIQNNTGELKKQFPLITDTRHWKIRYQNDKAFRINSTISEVESIKSVKNSIEQLLPNIQNNENAINPINITQNISFIPQETIELLQNAQSQICSLIQMYYNITVDSTLFHNFLKFITNLWKTNINSNGEYGDIDKVKSTILNSINNDNESDFLIQLYEENLEYLLPQSLENSQICDYITFYSFAHFFIRYCDWFDYSFTLREITFFNESTQSMSFYNWFHPSTSKSHAIQLLQAQTTESWIVIPSKSPNMFILLFTRGGQSANISKIHIVHNPVPEDPYKRYSIDSKESATLNDLFTNVLKLDTSNVQPEISYQPAKTQNVSADDIANRKNNQNSDEENGTGFNLPSALNSQTDTFDYAFSNSQRETATFNQNSQSLFSESQYNDFIS